MRRAVILGVSVVLAAGALTASPAAAYTPDPTSDELRTAGVTVAAEQAAAAGIAFGACPTGTRLKAPIQCGRVQVPVDYGHPEGRKISLLVSRLKASGPAKRRQGPLLFNPGGPGGSGLWFPRLGQADMPSPTKQIWAATARTYDMVGFDPRGVGYSAPISCVPPSQFQQAPTADPRHPGAAVKRRERARAKAVAAGCLKRSGALLGHMTTADIARDVDVIRAALHQPKLNYFGVSYGTYLGAVYAHMFSSHVRRMVLDSVVDPDPRGIWYGANLEQDIAFERRWADWRTWAARHNKVYRLGTTPARVQASFERAMQRLAKHPAGGKVGPGELHGRAVQAAYYDPQWVPFAYQLSSYLRGDAKPLTAAATPDPRTAKDDENGEAVYLAVQCGDAPWPRDWNTWERDNSRLAKRYPFETWSNAWLNLPCKSWPVPSSHPVDVRVSPHAGLPPVLLLQSERDAATPYGGAVSLHHRLPGSRLVTEVGRGSHGLISFRNRCLNDRVDHYLLTGRTDAHDVRCTGHPLPVPTGAHGAQDANSGRYY
ncbi:alpha/beta hydrolase [Streptomyces sp. NPDC059373]